MSVNFILNRLCQWDYGEPIIIAQSDSSALALGLNLELATQQLFEAFTLLSLTYGCREVIVKFELHRPHELCEVSTKSSTSSR